MNNTKKIEMLKTGSIPSTLLRMGLPTMIGMLVTALYSLVDAYFVAGLGISQMGAVSIIFPVSQIIVGVGLLFGSGAASYISRLLGENETKKANTVASIALYSSLCIGVILIALLLIFSKNILLFLGATETIFPYAKVYMTFFISGSILNIFNVTVNHIFTSEGSAKLSMIAMLSGAGLNIVLDPLLIYTFNMGIKGAAIASIIAQLISAIIYLSFIFRKVSIFSFSIKYYSFDKNIYLQILKIGIPTFIFQLLTSLGIGLTNTAATNYGDNAIAALGIVTRIVSIGNYVIFGFTKGFQPVAGYNYGAKQFIRLHKSITTTLKWTTIFCVIFSAIMIIFPTSIMNLFSNGNIPTVTIGTMALRTNGIMFIFFGFQMVYANLFLAIGKGKEGSLLSISRSGIFFIPFILIMPLLLGLKGIIYAQPFADLCTVILTGIMAIKITKEINSLGKKDLSLANS